MIYEIEVRASAEHDLFKLQSGILKRVDKKIRSLKNDPRPSGVLKLHGEGGWRLRVGDWRIIYDIDDRMRKVFVSRVRHRSEVYQR